MDSISINELLTKIDEYSINYDFNNDDDIYYNDSITNYEEV